MFFTPLERIPDKGMLFAGMLMRFHCGSGEMHKKTMLTTRRTVFLLSVCAAYLAEINFRKKEIFVR